MIAVSAIVTGLPGGVVQKNRDAALLSPARLLDGSLGNRVHIRRPDGATGKVTEEEAIIRSGAAGAVVVQTAAGSEWKSVVEGKSVEVGVATCGRRMLKRKPMRPSRRKQLPQPSNKH